jgi:hypothetical protein
MGEFKFGGKYKLTISEIEPSELNENEVESED